MDQVHIKLQIFFGLFLWAISVVPVPAADFWYEDNNLGRAGASPPDFVEKFRSPESFSQATKYIDVYMIRAKVLIDLDDQSIESLLIPYLQKNGIELAVDAGGATWAQQKGRIEVANKEIRLLLRLKRLGLKASYISLQSVLSKPLRGGGKMIDYPLDKRIVDVVAYAKKAQAIFPDVEIGIIDALPSHGKDYRQPYRLLQEAMRKGETGLSYIHLDMPFIIPKERRHGVTWEKIREVESFVEGELGLKFGYFTTSATGGRISSKAFHQGVMADLYCYATSGGTPHDYIVASWFQHPQKTIPETAIGDEYPAMRTVLEFGHQLEQLEKAGSAWAGRKEHLTEWRLQCE